MLKFFSIHLAAVGAALTGLSTPILAFDSGDLAEKLQSALAASDNTIRYQDIVVADNGVTLSGVVLAVPTNTKNPAIEIPLGAVSLQEISATFVADGDRMAFSSDILRFGIDPALPDTDPVGKNLLQLGLRRIEGNMHMEGFWDPASGMLSMTDLYLDIDSVGKLGARFDIGGHGASPKAFRLHNGALYFQDWGLTDAVLEAAAREQNVSRAQMDMTMLAMIPVIAAHIEPKQLAEQFIETAHGFLIDGGAIGIEINPASPVAFGAMGEALLENPFSLPALLGTTLRAND